MTRNAVLLGWVGEIARLTQAAELLWCDGSTSERSEMVVSAALAGALFSGSSRPAHVRQKFPMTSPRGFEQHTFVCTPSRAEAAPMSSWMPPSVAYRKLEKLVRGSLRAGTLYVVPHVVENLALGQGRVVVELTNSYSGILSMRGSGPMGKEA